MRFYPLIIVATVEAVTRMEITSCVVGVILSALGGGLSQMGRAESKDLPWGQVIAEWGLSGLLGLVTHTAAMKATSDPFMIWSSCVLLGLGGSEALYRMAKKR